MCYNNNNNEGDSMEKLCQKFAQVGQLFGKKWVPLIIYELLNGPKRFHDLEQVIEISGKMLSERLKTLEAEGVIVRNVYAETPVRIEYELTQKGRDLKPIIESMVSWSQLYY
jgi:DNA-binding HxlR family transcriptional regulator